MIPEFIEAKRPALAGLCQRFGARRLELFGSAAKGTFDPATSDLDFLVEFPEEMTRGRADAYFGLLFALQDLFGRPVDLTETTAIGNPYFLEGIRGSRTVVYAA